MPSNSLKTNGQNSQSEKEAADFGDWDISRADYLVDCVAVALEHENGH